LVLVCMSDTVLVLSQSGRRRHRRKQDTGGNMAAAAAGRWPHETPASSDTGHTKLWRYESQK
jgi:hypothetical protein